MPKISNQRVKVRSDADTYVEYQVFYNSEYGFHAQVPDQFNDVFDLMPEKDHEALHCRKVFKSGKRITTGVAKRCILGTGEDNCIANMYSFLQKAVEYKTVKRDVIIVFYQTRETNFGGHEYNNDHPGLSLQLGLTYCTEVVVGDGKPDYYKFTKPTKSYIEVKKQRVSVWDKEDACVIDDTKENRAFVEQLYAALLTLQNKLKDYTKSGKSFLALIASRQKLLN